MFCLVYNSHAVTHMTRMDIQDILDTSIAFNKQHDVTGLLLYRDKQFMQILEGEQDTVQFLYQRRICQDARHKNFEVIFSDFIVNRNFSDWQMGFHFVEGEFSHFCVELLDKVADTANYLDDKNHQFVIDFSITDTVC